MDLTAGILAANAPIGKMDPIGNYSAGRKAGQEAVSKGIENEKSRYEQDLTYKLQEVINKSVDAKGDLDFDALAKHGTAAGIAPSVIQYAIKTLPAQWEAAKSTISSKNAIGAVAPGTEKDLTKAATPSWRDAPARSTIAAANPRVDIEAARAQQAAPAPTVDHTGGTQEEGRLPPTAGDYVSPDQRNYANAEGGQVVVSAPQEAQAPAAVEEPAQSNLMATANMADLGSATNDTQSPLPNVTSMPTPIQFSSLAPATQSKMKTAMVQEGKVGAGATPADVQAALDANYQQTLTGIVVPNKRMFLSPDKGFDQGAYSTAVAQYEAGLPAMSQKWLTDMGKKYGEQIAQEIQVQANKRAAAANDREQRGFDQTQEAVKAQRAEGYNANASNVDKIVELRGLRQGIENAKAEVEDIRKASPTLSDEEFNGKFDATLQNLKAAEGINSINAEENLMSNLRKDKTVGQIVGESKDLKDFISGLGRNTFASMPREERLNTLDGILESVLKAGNVAGKLDAYKLKGWRSQPAKAPKAGSARRQATAEDF